MGDVPLREPAVWSVRRAGVAWKGELMDLGLVVGEEGEGVVPEGDLSQPWGDSRGLGFATRRCPRCGEMVYADVGVCYGCLFDFSRLDGQGGAASVGSAAPAGAVVPAQTADPAGSADPAGAMARTGPRAAVPEVTAGADATSGRTEGGPNLGQAADVLAVIGPAEGDGAGISDTGGGALVPADCGELCPGSGDVPGFYLTSASVDVWVPVRPGGSVLGRDPACDVVLHAPAVSRRHAFLRARADGMEVTDLGATNPARFRGEQVDGRLLVPWGQTLDLCGYALTMTGPPSG